MVSYQDRGSNGMQMVRKMRKVYTSMVKKAGRGQVGTRMARKDTMENILMVSQMDFILKWIIKDDSQKI